MKSPLSTRALFIDIEAIDRAGKTTLISTLVERIAAAGWSVVETEYPDRRAPLTGALIDDFLRDSMNMVDHDAMLAQGNPRLLEAFRDAFPSAEFTLDLGGGDPRWRTFEAAASEAEYTARHTLLGQELFCLNRRECSSKLEYLVATHDVVVTSRYQLSGKVYGEGLGIPRAQMVKLVDSLEPDLRKPDLTLVIDVDADAVANRPRKGGLDRHERDFGLQHRVAAIFREYAQTDPSIVLVDGSSDIAENQERLIAALDARHPELRLSDPNSGR